MQPLKMEKTSPQGKLWVLLVEDEARLRDALAAQLRELCTNFGADFGDICTASTVEEALLLCRQGDPTVAFIDIHLPGTSGMRLAEALSNTVDVVLVTAHDEYAVEAFAHGAADYLLKPVTQARLQQCIARLRKRAAARARGDIDLVEPRNVQAIDAAPQPFLKWLTATRGRKTYLIAVDDIIFMKADNKYIRVVCRDNEHLIEEPLKGIIARLDPNHFRQVHRAAVVNLREVLLVERDEAGAGAVKFRHHAEALRISAPYLRELRMFLV